MAKRRRTRRPRTTSPEAPPSPAERYAAFKEQQAKVTPTLRDFLATLDFPPDPFQLDAMYALDRGEGVLVAAPTSSGKTLVAEYGLARTLANGARAFYTTPIKALSNQKYRDFQARFGADRVGLVTGDVTLNPQAPIVVMTTEVTRNMLYRGDARLDDLQLVVMDEVHYLGNRERGPVWEEVILHLDASVQLVSLSATVSNAEEFGAWLSEVRGTTTVIVSEDRPVPLIHHMIVDGRLYDLYRAGSGTYNPQLLAAIGPPESGRGGSRRRAHPVRGARGRGQSYLSQVLALRREHLLPAIFFVFSRARCDAAVRSLLLSPLALTSDDEAQQIATEFQVVTAILPEATRRALNVSEIQAGAERGFATHHAGMLPLLKELIERLFAAGLLKVLFATETLALGINMPARTVVVTELRKWNGSDMAPVTPGEFTQLTGRAGRRSLDSVGHAVVPYQPTQRPEAVGRLASKRSYALRSSFHPTYNMTVNLLARMDEDEARSLLERSFAQFQADRAVVGEAQTVRRLKKRLTKVVARMACTRGDFVSYLRLKRRVEQLEAGGADPAMRAEAARVLAAARPGDILAYYVGGRVRLGLVWNNEDSSPDVLTDNVALTRLDAEQAPYANVGFLDLAGLQVRRPRERKRLASQLRAWKRQESWSPPPRPDLDEATMEVVAHPCHRCPDRLEHEAHARDFYRVDASLTRALSAIERRTSSIAARFDRVCAVLTELGYLAEDARVTDAGLMLAEITTEQDLLIAECLRQRLWVGLEAPDLAGVVSACLFKARVDRPEDPHVMAGRGSGLARGLADTIAVSERLAEVEQRAGLDPASLPEPQLSYAVAAWAKGAPLEAILADNETLTGGDFVRHIKQVIDVLRQLTVVDAAIAVEAKRALTSLKRDVVVWGDDFS